MAIKTFTTGEVLTAADTNTYLANSGLVYIKQQTVGSGVGSVTVSSAFSSTYDNYKIIYSGGTGSTSAALQLNLGSTITGYYGALIYGTSAGGGPTTAGYNNAATWTHSAGCTATGIAADMDLIAPFLAVRTRLCNASYMDDSAFGTTNGALADTTSYTAFTFTPTGGTLTGGVIYIFGYRKA
jgi:hypothetical protein